MLQDRECSQSSDNASVFRVRIYGIQFCKKIRRRRGNVLHPFQFLSCLLNRSAYYFHCGPVPFWKSFLHRYLLRLVTDFLYSLQLVKPFSFNVCSGSLLTLSNSFAMRGYSSNNSFTSDGLPDISCKAYFAGIEWISIKQK